MTDALTKSLGQSRAFASSVHANALRQKGGGVLEITSPGSGFGSEWQQRAGDFRRYELFRGWVYAAINVIASEAAGQEAKIGRLKGANPNTERSLSRTKGYLECKLPRFVRQKKAKEELEVVADSPLLDAIAQPNFKQGQWQFVYSFIANLCLTGWSYVVGGDNGEGGLEFYSLPTTWVTPIPDENGECFRKFRVKNPVLSGEGEVFDRSQIAFAHLPNPADLLGALAPAEARSHSIKIDDDIQTSRSRFFQNGIFPSVIVTVGKDPHPSGTGMGTRPRLTAPQRRQVIGAIRKTMGGVANYGNPGIVDGLIESIKPLSMKATEMGWKDSEEQVKTQILSVFSVHPFMLGEAVNVGGYAQSAIIVERFCKRVNTYLSMLGRLMTNFAGPMVDQSNRTVVWWEECEPHDPQIHWNNINKARDRNDISQDEFRQMIGLPPDEDQNESVIDRQSVQQIVTLMGSVADRKVSPEQAVALMEGMGLPTDMAKEIAGKAPPPPIPLPEGEPPKPTEQEQAADELGKAVAALESSERLLEELKT